MSVVEQGQLKGPFSGFHDHNTVFEFTNGKKWRQIAHRAYHQHAHMPAAKVIQEGGRYMLYVQGISDPVEVLPA